MYLGDARRDALDIIFDKQIDLVLRKVSYVWILTNAARNRAHTEETFIESSRHAFPFSPVFTGTERERKQRKERRDRR